MKINKKSISLSKKEAINMLVTHFEKYEDPKNILLKRMIVALNYHEVNFLIDKGYKVNINS